MRLASGIPGLIARSGELVERNVDSNIELEQTALIALPPVSEHLRVGTTSAVAERASFINDRFIPLVNPNGTITEIFAILGRGLWRINAHLAYSSNYITDAPGGLEGAGLFITEDPSILPTVAVWRGISQAGSVAVVISDWISFDLTCDVEGYTLWNQVFAPPAAGNTALYTCQLMGLKLL